MMDDSSAYGIEDEQEDTGQEARNNPAEQRVAVGDTVIDDEPEQLDEDVTGDSEYEPLEPDEPA